MDGDLSILMATACSVGFLHTILGPDHYVPFVAMSKCNNWSFAKTLCITTLCGLGHVASSVLIGAIGLLIGAALFRVKAFEAFRGEGAAWLLIGFGLAYFVWAVIRAIRDVPHTHTHAHADGTVHSHLHRHDLEHRHVHDRNVLESCDAAETTGRRPRMMTPWILFLIFAFGPCEVLIPLLMYPAAEANTGAIFLVVAAFTIATVGTMVMAVTLLGYGLSFVRMPDLHRYGHAMAGLAVMICGALIKFGL